MSFRVFLPIYTLIIRSEILSNGAMPASAAFYRRIIMNRKRWGFLFQFIILFFLNVTVQASDYYVNNTHSKANDANPGTQELPWTTISAAAVKARAGDTIWIFSGTYRETIHLPRGGSDSQHPISIRAMPNAKVKIKGSDLVTQWVHHSGSIWKRSGWQENSQQVFVDEKPLKQLGKNCPFNNQEFEGKPKLSAVGKGLADMSPGSFWYDQASKTLYISPPDGSDPNTRMIEASVRDWIIPPGPSDKDYGFIELHHLMFSHSNQTSKGNEMGLVNVWGRAWVVSGCSFTYGDFAGLHICGEGHKIVNNVVNHNGCVGIGINGSDEAHHWKSYSPRPPQNILLEGNETSFNNYRRFSRSWHGGGIKAVPSCNAVEISRHQALSNYGPGIWFDGWCRNISINRCIVKNNDGSGIFYEISDKATISNNLVVGNSQQGIYVSASDEVDVINNTIDKNWAGLVMHGMPRADHPSLRNNRIRNNIMSESTMADLVMYTNPATTAGNSSDYNLYYRPDQTVRISWTKGSGYDVNYRSLAAFAAATGNETHSLVGDPLWVDRAAGEYSLRAGSPAIGAGTLEVRGFDDHRLPGRTGVAVGLEGKKQVISLGAYEYNK
jgi:parallel beta-helix repeat protein